MEKFSIILKIEFSKQNILQQIAKSWKRLEKEVYSRSSPCKTFSHLESTQKLFKNKHAQKRATKTTWSLSTKKSCFLRGETKTQTHVKLLKLFSF